MAWQYIACRQTCGGEVSSLSTCAPRVSRSRFIMSAFHLHTKVNLRVESSDKSCGHRHGPAAPLSLPTPAPYQPIHVCGRWGAGPSWHNLTLPDHHFNHRQGIPKETDPRTGLSQQLSRPCLGAADPWGHFLFLEHSDLRLLESWKRMLKYWLAVKAA